MEYKFIFGPVPSRRLGRSLGVDVLPGKYCSFNCIYCECGKTDILTTTRKNFFKVNDIVNEIKDKLKKIEKPDHITFSGMGEPTLYKNIGELIREIKKITDIPLVLLTNSTFLSNEAIREELKDIDIIVPTLNAVSQDIFEKINCPAKGIKITDIINGLCEFNKNFNGKMWLEIFLIDGINTNSKELNLLNEISLKIAPDKIQLNSLDRPGADKNVKPISYEKMQEYAKLFSFYNIEILTRKLNIKKEIKTEEEIENIILETISRRPCTINDIINITGCDEKDIKSIVKTLSLRRYVKLEELENKTFIIKL